MTAKIIKEIIIGLVTILLVMLLFAVILYEYIPNRKVVPEVLEYKASDIISEQLSDNVDQANNQVVLTYEVTASDLNNYKITNDYVPGKANPFAAVVEDPESTSTPEKSSETGKTSSSTNSENSQSNEGDATDKGMK